MFKLQKMARRVRSGQFIEVAIERTQGGFI